MTENEQWYKEQHEKMWQWLADNPTKYKDEWPGWEVFPYAGGNICNRCFACAFADAAIGSSGKHMCDFCPCWREDESCLYRCEQGDNSIYSEWEDIGGLYLKVFDAEEDEWLDDDDWLEKDLEKRTQLALEIKNMWRKVDE